MTREEKIKIEAENFANSLMTVDDHELYAAEEGFIIGADFEHQRMIEKTEAWIYEKLHDGYIYISKCDIVSLIEDYVKAMKQ